MSDLISRADLFNSVANCHDKGEIFTKIQEAATVEAVPVEEFERLKSELQNCRDELCLHCGKYRRAHLVA